MAAVWWGDTTTNQKPASTVGGALKRRDYRGGTCGGVLSLCLERGISEEIKWQWKYVVAIDGCWWMKIHNNQPKARWRDKGGEGGELRLARGARGKRKLIVWGQLSWVWSRNPPKQSKLMEPPNLWTDGHMTVPFFSVVIWSMNPPKHGTPQTYLSRQTYIYSLLLLFPNKCE